VLIEGGKYMKLKDAKYGLYGQALSWRRITPLLRRLGHSPDGLLQTFQCGALLGVN
jgi:hypothetical protein